jgi:hypothetical protein
MQTPDGKSSLAGEFPPMRDQFPEIPAMRSTLSRAQFIRRLKASERMRKVRSAERKRWAERQHQTKEAKRMAELAQRRATARAGTAEVSVQHRKADLRDEVINAERIRRAHEEARNLEQTVALNLQVRVFCPWKGKWGAYVALKGEGTTVRCRSEEEVQHVMASFREWLTSLAKPPGVAENREP